MITLGFSSTVEVETAPGVWTKQKSEKRYKADVLAYNRHYDSQTKINEDISLKNRYSIVMKEKAEKYTELTYVIIDGFKWKVTTIEYLSPRLILSVGGAYLGE